MKKMKTLAQKRLLQAIWIQEKHRRESLPLQREPGVNRFRRRTRRDN